MRFLRAYNWFLMGFNSAVLLVTALSFGDLNVGSAIGLAAGVAGVLALKQPEGV